MKPKISIITAIYNDKENIAATIESILAQTYPYLEYIIIDGGSTDGSIEIINQYLQDKPKWLKHNINKFISQKDNGISDAFNKGVNLSSGDYINFQGASDVLDNKYAIEEMFEDVDSSFDLILGRIKRVSNDEYNKILYFSKNYKKFPLDSLLWKMSVPHQALFTNKRFFEKYGLFRLEKIYSMDYEQLLRAYKDRKRLKVLYKNIFISRWKEGGIGDGKIKEILLEYHQNRVENKIANKILLDYVYFWSLFKFYTKSVIIKIIKGQ